MKLVVGLGNPGSAYTNNRHNIGFECLGYFARTQGIKLDKKQGKARIGTGEIAGIKFILARPQTYMNESGDAVSRLVKKFDIDPDGLVVIHDDLDLPLGKLRIRQDGSSGGHKGVESIILYLGSQGFTRVRVGIGRPLPLVSEMNEADIIDYVLSDFTVDQVPIVSAVIARASGAIYCLLTEGISAAMNKYH